MLHTFATSRRRPTRRHNRPCPHRTTRPTTHHRRSIRPPLPPPLLRSSPQPQSSQTDTTGSSHLSIYNHTLFILIYNKYLDLISLICSELATLYVILILFFIYIYVFYVISHCVSSLWEYTNKCVCKTR